MGNVNGVRQAIALFEREYDFNYDTAWFSMEHDILMIPGPDREIVTLDDIEYLDDLGVIWSDEYDGWATY